MCKNEKMVEIKQIGKLMWKIEKTGKMNIPVVILASEELIEAMKTDSTLNQAVNMSMLPGVLKNVVVLSDAHQGYGACIGGVVAYDLNEGVISPGEIGYDINCSVRLLKTNLKKQDIMKKQKETTEALYRKIPSGVGRGSRFNLTKEELKKILKGGAKYMVEKGYGIKEDYINTEEKGNMKQANPDKVSERAMKRGIGQLGTIGAGNHFIEVQYVDEIFDEKTAKKLGIEKNQAIIMIHCGSRGLGHQVASDYIKKMEQEYGFKNLPDRELINAPIKSKLGEDYFEAMCAAANFAFANKQLITFWIREEMKYLFPKSEINVIYDVCHNIAKFEKHKINGKIQEVCVHRKGATRSFDRQPVIIPGSMGTASYILVGTDKSDELAFGSTVHGAGRVRSRSYAIKNLKGEKIKEKLNKEGIEIKAGSWKSLAEEAPEVYKDIEEVVNVVDELGISKKVARLKPLIVVKG
jgi:tRNA-splicing ligase RtcB